MERMDGQFDGKSVGTGMNRDKKGTVFTEFTEFVSIPTRSIFQDLFLGCVFGRS
jgi:hypothetical protein